jgi:hypothetical protein
MRLVTVAPPPGEPAHEVARFREWWDAHRPGWVDPSWWSMPIREEVAGVLSLRAGPDLLTALQRLDVGRCPAEHASEGMPGDPAPGTAPGFPCGCQLVLSAAWRAVTSWTAVRAAQALTDAVGPEPVTLPADRGRPGIVDPAREEVSVAIRLAPGSTTVVMRRARALSAHPAAARIAREGVLPLRTVEQVCEAVARLSAEDAQRVIEQWCRRVRDRATGSNPMTGMSAMRSAKRLILAAPSYREVRNQSRNGRRVEVWSNDDGTATLSAILPEECAHRVHRRLSAIARGLDDPQDDRSMDAKRADALVDVLLGTMHSQATGVEMTVTIPVASLLGLTDGPAEVPGVGAIPDEVARTLAADARWRAWLTSADGTVVATSSTTYRPSAELARLVRARHPECRMPGCRRPAEACDIDHAKPWPEGATTVDNLGPLCRRHHVMKTHYGWDLIPDADVWRTPAGATVPLAA